MPNPKANTAFDFRKKKRKNWVISYIPYTVVANYVRTENPKLINQRILT